MSGSGSKQQAEFPISGPFEDQARQLIQLATLAPSGHNTQPWMFAIGDNAIDVMADRRRALPVVDPYDRELTISCGAAIGTLEVAANRYDLDAGVQYLPDAKDPDLLARVTIAPATRHSPSDPALFNAIFDRRTTRVPFADDALPVEVSESCVQQARALGVEVQMSSDRAVRQDLAALVAEGDRRQFDDPAFRRELASWVHATRSKSRDGMSGLAFGLPDIRISCLRWAVLSSGPLTSATAWHPGTKR